MIKKLKLRLMVASVLFKIKVGQALVSVPKIGIPMLKTACISLYQPFSGKPPGHLLINDTIAFNESLMLILNNFHELLHCSHFQIHKFHTFFFIRYLVAPWPNLSHCEEAALLKILLVELYLQPWTKYLRQALVFV